MKIRIKEPHYLDLDEIDIEKTDNFSMEEFKYETQPLVITDFMIGKNNRGQMVITFSSKNHKYFNIWDTMSWKSWDDNQIDGEEESEFGSRGLHIESQTEVYDKELGFKRSLWSTEMIITPETEEEKELLADRVSSIANKWGYSLVFLDFGDYGIDNLDEENNMDETFELGDNIYHYEKI
jgi:hypothetical protein